MDEQLLRKKLAFLETCLADLRRLGRPDLLEFDVEMAPPGAASVAFKARRP